MRRLLACLFLATLLSACTASVLRDIGPAGSGMQTVPLPAGSFVMDAGGGGGHGDVYVRGYAQIARKEDPFCAPDRECPPYKYVWLRLTEGNTGALLSYLRTNAGNAFVGTQSIGLGCFSSGGLLTYVNDSDSYGRKTYALSPGLSRAILGSTAAHPLTLVLTKEQYSGGTDAPPCYAHFTSVARWTPPTEKP